MVMVDRAGERVELVLDRAHAAVDDREQPADLAILRVDRADQPGFVLDIEERDLVARHARVLVALGHARQRPFGADFIREVARDDRVHQHIILPRELRFGAAGDERRLLQQLHAVIMMDDRGGLAETRFRHVEHVAEDPVLIVELGHVRRAEVQVDAVSPHADLLIANGGDDRFQPLDILFVGEEHHDDGVGQLARAEAADIGVAGAAVDQHIVETGLMAGPLIAQVLEHQEAFVIVVEVLPVDRIELLSIAGLGVPAGGHQPDRRSRIGRAFDNEVRDIGRAPIVAIAADIVDDASAASRAAELVERGDAGRFEIEIDDQDALAGFGQEDGDVD